MVRLSVNVNKVATLRNSRGGDVPSVVEAVRVCLDAGAAGITVHPRADARHITFRDVRDIAAELARSRDDRVELNIEGDARPDLMALVHEVKPDQCTLVPVLVGERTSQGGWPAETPVVELRRTIEELREARIRVSLFIDADLEAVRWAASLRPDRVELFTEPYARAFNESSDEGERSFQHFAKVATVAHDLGLGVNAGHDLDHRSLVRFRELPYLAEVSIGHALISRALFHGLDRVVREYLDVL
ncbi:MAG: pyridoxine 5'-phosphate synthase [Luteitalea sp.]|nr:pyridoxine 5'-phosphate synthase [Luteitalea sp.]